jgi:hypothetical protein
LAKTDCVELHSPFYHCVYGEIWLELRRVDYVASLGGTYDVISGTTVLYLHGQCVCVQKKKTPKPGPGASENNAYINQYNVLHQLTGVAYPAISNSVGNDL